VDICGSEVTQELIAATEQVMSTKEQHIFISAVLKLKTLLIEDGVIRDVEFTETVNIFYDTFLECIQNWAKSFAELCDFK
jgi:hypothetical protein